MRIIDVYFRRFLIIRPQLFTEKLMAGKELILHIPIEKEKIQKVIEEIEWIERNTHEMLYIGFYMLDRWVNPLGSKDKVITLPLSLDCKSKDPDYFEKHNGQREFTLRDADDYKVQDYLCKAIGKIQQLVSSCILDSGLNFDEIYMSELANKSRKEEVTFA